MPRVVLGVCGGIAAYKAVEVCRRLVDAGVHVAPGPHRRRAAFRRARSPSRRSPPSPRRTSLFGGPEPIPHTRLGQSADLIVVAPATARLLGQVRGRHLRRPAHRHAPRHPGAGAGVPGDAHRDVGARRGPGEPRHAAPPRACTCSTPRRAAWPAATPAPAGSPIPARSSPARARAPRGRASAHRAARCVVTAGGTREADRPGALRRATGRRGRWATRSPTSRPGSAPASVLVTTAHRPVDRRRSRSCRVESAQEMHDAVIGRFGGGRRGRDGRRGRRLPAQGAGRPEAQEGRRRARHRARADGRHPRRARPDEAARPGRGRVRGRDRAGRASTRRRSWRPSGSTSWSPTT